MPWALITAIFKVLLVTQQGGRVHPEHLLDGLVHQHEAPTTIRCGPTGRGSSGIAAFFDAAAICRLQLEGGVLDVEVARQALAEVVEDPAGIDPGTEHHVS